MFPGGPAAGQEPGNRLLVQVDILPHRHFPYQGQLLEDHGDSQLPGLLGIGNLHLLAVKEDLPFIRLVNACQHL